MTNSSVQPTRSNFAVDIQRGLQSEKKYISSKYFYDETGDLLFQKIMRTDEYYLTDSEYEILSSCPKELMQMVSSNGEAFDLIELGAGDGYKTKLLLHYLLNHKHLFTYYPIDISENVLQALSTNLKKELPLLNITPVSGEYISGINQIEKHSNRKKVILFLGSTIGNFSKDAAVAFLKVIRSKMNVGDHLLIGFDLMKDPRVVYNAYNDKHGYTAAFNLNVLTRINRELGGTFLLDQFAHYPFYDPETGEAKSYLVSLKEQEVFIQSLQETYSFQKGEVIHTEISQKFSEKMISNMAASTGFIIKKHFYDCRHYFADSLWEAS